MYTEWISIHIINIVNNWCVKYYCLSKKGIVLFFINFSYNPTLTYGQAKDPPKPVFQPIFNLLDGKSLSFDGFTKQTVRESPVDTYRVRCVKIRYFLVDDTISIFEPELEVNNIFCFYLFGNVVWLLHFLIVNVTYVWHSFALVLRYI